MYIHQHFCISPQQLGDAFLESIKPSVDGKLLAMEPVLEGVPSSMLRRMSKAVKIGIGAGLPLLKNNTVDGIIIGTANGGMEHCITFLNQIIDYDEGLLTPAGFVQSTPNAIAGQLSLITKNRGYNTTHVHDGLAFENALIDAQMLIKENPGKSYLVGGVDEISSYNYNIDQLAGWYNKAKSNNNLYGSNSDGTIAGEGSAMFIVNNVAKDAIATLNAVEVFESTYKDEIELRFKDFLQKNVPNMNNAIFISGENGDPRFLPIYTACKNATGAATPVVRYKHLTGEYPTATAFALWLACFAIQHQRLPNQFLKNNPSVLQIDSVIMYNQYQGRQHSFMYASSSKC